MMSTKKSDPQLFDKSNTTVPGNTYLRLVKILSHFEFLLTKLQNEYFWIFLILFVVLKFCRSHTVYVMLFSQNTFHGDEARRPLPISEEFDINETVKVHLQFLQ